MVAASGQTAPPCQPWLPACLLPTQQGSRRLSAPSFLCPNLVALLLVSRETESGLGSPDGGGEKEKGVRKH